MGRDPLEPIFSGDEEDSGHPESPPTFTDPPQESRVWPKRHRFKKTTAERVISKLNKANSGHAKDAKAAMRSNSAHKNYVQPDHDLHLWDPDYVDEDEQPPPVIGNKQQVSEGRKRPKRPSIGMRSKTKRRPRLSASSSPNATEVDEEDTATPPDTDNELLACQFAGLDERPRPIPLSVLLEENPDYDPMEALISNEDYQHFRHLSNEIRTAITQAENRILYNKENSLQFGVSGSIINRLALSTVYGTDLDVVLGCERGPSSQHVNFYVLEETLRGIGFYGRFTRQRDPLPWFKPVYRGYMADVRVDLSLDNSGIRLNRLIGASL
ncbi:hypothetical protein M3Y99_01603600 [Aphelenchoides fujianensis]|nr:hypothetical protein M3Y99_01603600 [Aphelenchoides fujianensis]